MADQITTVSQPADGASDDRSQGGVASQPDRRTFLGLSVAASGAALTLLAAPARSMPDLLDNDDRRALRFLEELELLQTDFFYRAASSAAAYGMEERERSIINLIAEQDREQAAWFRAARAKLGVAEFGRTYTPNTSVSRPPRTFMFSSEMFTTRTKLFPAAREIKSIAVAAYHGMVMRTDDGEITQAIAALAGIEGRHAAALQEISGVNPLPSAFEEALSPQVVLTKLAQHGFRGEAIQ
jgi:hypothetical protein